MRARASPSDSLVEEKPQSKGDGFLAGRKVSPAPKAKVGRESDTSVSQTSVFDADDDQSDESEDSNITSPDLASDHRDAAHPTLSPSFLAAIDDLFGKVDPTQQPNGYGYECE